MIYRATFEQKNLNAIDHLDVCKQRLCFFCVCVCVRTENESFAVAVSEAARWKRTKNVRLSLTIQNREIRTGRYKIVILSFFLIKSEILHINHIKQIFKVLYVECYLCKML